MTSGSSWASAARGWTSSTTSEPCVEARRRRLASGLVVPPGFLLAAPPVFLRLRRWCFCCLCRRCFCWLCCRCSCWLCRRCSGRRRARPPSAPRASLGASARSPARLVSPQSSRALISERPTNVACNSPATISNHELAALELQRFQTLLNLYPVELHATFGVDLAARRYLPHWWCVVYVPSPGPSFPAIPSGLIRIGCAHVDRLWGCG